MHPRNLARRVFAPRNLAATAILTIAVAGVAAAAIGSAGIINGSVTGIDLKNGTVTGLDVKNEALTGTDIKNATLRGRDMLANSVTGNQVDKSTLAAVPTATNSDKLGGTPAADYVLDSSMLKYSFGMMKGDAERTVGTFGPLTITATCVDAAGAEHATLWAATTHDNLYFSTTSHGEEVDFDIADGKLKMADQNSNSANSYVFDYPRITDPAGGFDVFSDGYEFGLWVNHVGKDCWFGGNLVNNAA